MYIEFLNMWVKFSKDLNLKNYDKFDWFLIICISLIPLSLAISIFVADFLASISGVYFLFLFIIKKQFRYLVIIKSEIIYFTFFYLIILFSLILTDYKNQSFLASFFYFRYFLLSLIIFYLLVKYKNFIQVLSILLVTTIFIVVFDALFQLITDYNLFGYEMKGSQNTNSMPHLTGFFNNEKKLGSYIARFAALLISFSYIYSNKEKFSKIILISYPIIFFVIFFSSERMGLFYGVVISIFYFLFLNGKSKIYLTIASLIIIPLFFIYLSIDKSTDRLLNKYFNYTLQQIGIKENPRYDKDYIRFFSQEHENLAYTSILIIKNNFLFGSGVKTFYQRCEDLKKSIKITKNKRSSQIVCSTHPHNLLLQIFSEIGFFGFIIFNFFLITIIKNLIIHLFQKNKSDVSNSFFFINLSLLINIFPFVPSGNFFNNWLSLILFFQIGIYLYYRKYFIK